MQLAETIISGEERFIDKHVSKIVFDSFYCLSSLVPAENSNTILMPLQFRLLLSRSPVSGSAWARRGGIKCINEEEKRRHKTFPEFLIESTFFFHCATKQIFLNFPLFNVFLILCRASVSRGKSNNTKSNAIGNQPRHTQITKRKTLRVVYVVLKIAFFLRYFFFWVVFGIFWFYSQHRGSINAIYRSTMPFKWWSILHRKFHFGLFMLLSAST